MHTNIGNLENLHNRSSPSGLRLMHFTLVVCRTQRICRPSTPRPVQRRASFLKTAIAASATCSFRFARFRGLVRHLRASMNTQMWQETSEEFACNHTLPLS